MKKIIIYLSSFALLLSALCTPLHVFADFKEYVEILDYCTLDGSGANNISASDASISPKFSFGQTLGGMKAYGYEIYVNAAASVFTVPSVLFGTHSHTPNVRFIGSGLYCISGSFQGLAQNSITVNLDVTGYGNFEFLSIRLYPLQYSYFDLNGTLGASAANGTTVTASFGSPEITLYPTFNSTGLNQLQYTVRISDYWTDFDQISFSAMINARSIDSIKCDTSSGVSLPVDFDVLHQSNSATQVYFLTVFLDVSNANVVEFAQDYLIFRITATVYNDANYAGAISLDRPQGHVVFSDNYFTNWFQRFNISLSNVHSYVNAINTKLQNIYNDIHNSLVPTVNNILRSLNQFLSSINNTVSTISTRVNSILTEVTSFFPDALEYLSQIAAGTAVNDDTMNEIEQGSSDLGGMSQEMGELTPDIDVETVTVPLEDIVSAEDQVSTNNLMLTIVDNQIITNFLLISVSFALMGFVFFGKR